MRMNGRTRSIAFAGPLRARRGSTILLVVTILSLLVLLAVTMTFASRMELSSAHNYSVGVQNRVASLTAVDAIARQLQESVPSGPLSPLDLTLSGDLQSLRPGEASASTLARLGDLPPNESLRRLSGVAIDSATSNERRDFRLIQTTGTGEVLVLDAGGRINLNAASVEVLEGFFEVVREEGQWPINPRAIAEAIVATRLGPDGAPGEKGVDDDHDAHLSVFTDENSAKTADWYYRGPEARTVDAILAAVREDPALIPQRDRQARQAARKTLMTNLDEADEYIADIRLPAFGDDVRFGSVLDLLAFADIRNAGMNAEIAQYIAPLVTTFSVSVDEVIVDGEARPLVDINRASAEELYEALVALYGDEKNPRLLMQYAVNIVDFRDADDTPTLYPGTSGPEAILGAERTPFISEVYPDATSPNDEGDDGQFVELHNPWNQDIDVTGWQLRGAGGVFPLAGRIAAGGYLILTDDIDNSLEDPDSATPGTGSLYDVFKVIPDGRSRRALAQAGFSLPDAGRNIPVTLFNASGDLIDVFVYTADPRDSDGLYSFQRNNPLVRESARLRATPFGLPPRSSEPDAWTLTRLQNYPQNGPFVSSVDLLSVFAGFADAREREASQWGFPQPVSPKSPSSRDRETAADRTLINALVLDAFTVESRPGTVALGDSSEKVSEKAHALGREDAESRTLLEQAGARPDTQTAVLAAVLASEHAPGWHHGRVNMNTAGELALASLPGISRNAAAAIVERRQRLLQRALEGEAEDGITYHVPSDLLVDDLIWPAAWTAGQRIDAMRQLLPHISLNSRAFLLVGQPRIEAGSDSDLQRAMRVEALVSVDRNAPEVLYRRKVVSPQ
ncbi:MAG: Lamin Tail Domain [Candidatus Sumerlaeota bacterium]|nr:Lamin Tail Domain [Candidatus Sumerlaeota bacterium]